MKGIQQVGERQISTRKEKSGRPLRERVKEYDFDIVPLQAPVVGVSGPLGASELGWIKDAGDAAGTRIL